MTKEKEIDTLEDLKEEGAPEKSELQVRQEECAAEIKGILDKHGFRLDASMQQTPLGNAIVASPILVDARVTEVTE